MKKEINEAPKKRLFNLKEAAFYLGHTEWGMRTLIWKKELPSVGLGRKYYIDIADLDQWIERSKKI